MRYKKIIKILLTRCKFLIPFGQMSTTTPIPVRFGEIEAELREAAKTCGISMQDAIRLSVGFGLPKLIQKLDRKTAGKKIKPTSAR